MANQVIRRCFNVRKWQPNRDQLMKAFECVQPEEFDRLMKFSFKDDLKASLIGRLLIRQCLVSKFSLSNRSIRLDRSEHGKPIWNSNRTNEANQENPDADIFDSICDSKQLISLAACNNQTIHAFDFNVSHQGDWCVLAGQSNARVGIDVMKFEQRGGSRTQSEYFQLMHSQFADKEWIFIRQASEADERLRRFLRLWSLKESFVKAQTIGISIDLQRIQFECDANDQLNQIKPVTSTRVYLDGKLLDRWRFEEWLLDADHVLCVAVFELNNRQIETITFEELQFEKLTQGLDSERDLSTMADTLFLKYNQKLDRL